MKGFFSALENDRFSTRPVLVRLVEENLQLILFLFDFAWMKVAQSDSPDWAGCIQFLRDCLHRCREWHALVMVAVAYRCIAVIQNEYLHDRQEALNTLDQAASQLPQPQYLIIHVRAGILSDMKEYDESLKLWGILREWPDCPPTVAFEVSRCGQMAAAAISDWKTVAMMARYGEKMAFRASIPLRGIAFRADEAFALWKDGAFDESIAMFASVLDSFWCLPDPTIDLLSYYIQRLVGHAIGWVHQQVTQSRYNWEPSAGQFSKLEIDERIRDDPMPSVLGLWIMLADTEFRKGFGKTFYKRLVRECAQQPQTDMQMMTASLGIKISLAAADSAGVLSIVCDCVEIMEANHHAILARHDIPEDLELATKSEAAAEINARSPVVLGVLSAAVLAHVNRYGPAGLPIREWKAECLNRGFSERRILDWFALLKQPAENDPADLEPVLLDNNADPYQRLLAAVLVLINQDSEPFILMYASLLLLVHASRDMWCETIERDIEELISRAWHNIAKENKFKLITPAVTSEEILRAVADSCTGLPKVARILLAARYGVHFRIPGDVFGQLRELASKG